MPLTAPVWEHEVVGYEQDQLFALDHSPAIMAVIFVDEEGNTRHGTIQEYISNAKCGGDFYNPDGADRLKSIPVSEVHSVAVSGIFKSLNAAHLNNYIIHADTSSPESSKIYEIDQEEILLSYNRIDEKEIMVGMKAIDEQIEKLKIDEEENKTEIEKLKAKKQMMRKSLILCRMWILGLPQNEVPFDRATLMMIAHPARAQLLHKFQHESMKSFSRESLASQVERLKMLQEFARKELEKESPTSTPRDLYFAIFGGEHLWKIAKLNRYPALIAFNNLISDPYQHLLKDFGDPESIPVCTRLDKPRDDSAEALEILHFLRKMERVSQDIQKTQI